MVRFVVVLVHVFLFVVIVGRAMIFIVIVVVVRPLVIVFVVRHIYLTAQARKDGIDVNVNQALARTKLKIPFCTLPA